MKNKLRFTFSTPPIRIWGLDDPLEWSMSSEFQLEGIEGEIKILLDGDSIDWEVLDRSDPFFDGPSEAEVVPRDCTGLIVEIHADRPPDMNGGFFLGTLHSLILETLDTFVTYVRLELGQYWFDLGAIEDWGLWDLIHHGKAVSIVDGQPEPLGFPIGGFPSGLKPRAPESSYPYQVRSLQDQDSEEIGSWNEPKFLLHLSLLADARKHLALGDRRSASIEAITVLEGVLEPFIKDRCREKGISNNALSNFDKTHFIGDYLKLLLPLVVDDAELQEFLDQHLESLLGVKGAMSADDLILWALELNGVRNRAVHYGEDPPFQIVDRGIFSVNTLVEFVRSR